MLLIKQIASLWVVGATLALSQAAFAQAPSVKSTLTANLVEQVAGKTVLAPASQAEPGDVVQYTSTYANTGTGTVEHLRATIPVPAGTTYLASSANPGAAQASTDNLHFAPVPLMHGVKQADGSVRQEPVPLADYKALRWDVSALAPSKDQALSLRVRINSPTDSASPQS